MLLFLISTPFIYYNPGVEKNTTLGLVNKIHQKFLFFFRIEMDSEVHAFHRDSIEHSIHERERREELHQEAVEKRLKSSKISE